MSPSGTGWRPPWTPSLRRPWDGEHGIGAAKARFMEKEVGRGTITYSKRIKAALDPKNILNPGKSIGE
jgi:glycolate oxidase